MSTHAEEYGHVNREESGSAGVGGGGVRDEDQDEDRE